MGTSTQGAGASLWLRSVIERPGLSSSQVRSAVIAPHGMTVTLFAVAMGLGPSTVEERATIRPWHVRSRPVNDHPENRASAVTRAS